MGRETGLIASYIHMGGKIGVLVALEGPGPKSAEASALAKDLAMQVAAANPTYVSRKDVPADVIEHEKSIYRDQAKASGKPDKILDKIAEGKLEKYYGISASSSRRSSRTPTGRSASSWRRRGRPPARRSR